MEQDFHKFIKLRVHPANGVSILITSQRKRNILQESFQNRLTQNLNGR